MVFSMRLRSFFVAFAACACLVGCSNTPATPGETDASAEVQNISLTQESDEEIAGRTRDIEVIAKRNAVAISSEAAGKILSDKGFDNVKLLCEGADGVEDGTEAAKDSSAMELVGWWVDSHDRVWALHLVSGDFFASRVWLDESEATSMIVVSGDRVTMYNADFGRLVKVGTKELEHEGVQVVRVESLDAKSLDSVEVSQ
jgi:hypothetical protein